MHGELKRICGFGRCQVNIGRAGCNHIGFSFVALVRKYRRRCRDFMTPYQQDWEVIKPGIQQALALAMEV